MTAFLGIILFSFFNSGRKKTVGQILIGLGLLFIGIKSMESALTPLTQLPAFQQLFLRFSNPFLGIAAGAAITALIQSSTASVAILQALTASGLVTFSTAMPIIMGQNIGTCVTAILSSIGASRNAKRTAAVHLFFNVIGTLVFLTVLYSVNAAISLPFWNATMTYGSIADLHSIFNIVCTILLLPFNRWLVRLVEWIIPDSETVHPVSTVLDPRFLSTPSVALERARTVVIQMGDLAKENYATAVSLLARYDSKQLEQLEQREEAIDHMEGALDQYLVQCSRHSLDDRDSDLVSDLLHALSDFERIGDYVVNLSESATALHDKDLVFSDQAQEELSAVCSAVGDALEQVMTAYHTHDSYAAFQVEPLEEVVDLITATLRERHVERLKKGSCTVELGTQFLELLINLERISDHCSNAAVRIIHRKACPTGKPFQEIRITGDSPSRYSGEKFTRFPTGQEHGIIFSRRFPYAIGETVRVQHGNPPGDMPLRGLRLHIRGRKKYYIPSVQVCTYVRYFRAVQQGARQSGRIGFSNEPACIAVRSGTGILDGDIVPAKERPVLSRYDKARRKELRVTTENRFWSWKDEKSLIKLLYAL